MGGYTKYSTRETDRKKSGYASSRPMSNREMKAMMGPWIRTHCPIDGCGGTMKLVCEWLPYGDESFPIKRKWFHRRCRRCGCKNVDRQCQGLNRKSNEGAQRQYNRTYRRDLREQEKLK